jgi:hypothetical protein
LLCPSRTGTETRDRHEAAASRRQSESLADHAVSPVLQGGIISITDDPVLMVERIALTNHRLAKRRWPAITCA